MLKSVLDLWYDIFIAIVKTCVPIVLFVMICVMIKIIYRYKKYGYRLFDVFQKKNSPSSRQELIFTMLSKLDGYRKIVHLKELHSSILLIDQSGIYLLYLFYEEGLITGDSSDKHLILKQHSTNEGKVMNPFLLLDEDEVYLRKKIGDEKIQKCVVINGLCMFQARYPKEYEVIYMNRFFFYFEHKTVEVCYGKEEVEAIYKRIVR